MNQKLWKHEFNPKSLKFLQGEYVEPQEFMICTMLSFPHLLLFILFFNAFSPFDTINNPSTRQIYSQICNMGIKYIEVYEENES